MRSLIAADLSFEFLSRIECQLLYVSISYSIGDGEWSDLGFADSLIPLFKAQEIVVKHLKGLCHAICYLFYKLKCVFGIEFTFKFALNLHEIPTFQCCYIYLYHI